MGLRPMGLHHIIGLCTLPANIVKVPAPSVCTMLGMRANAQGKQVRTVIAGISLNTMVTKTVATVEKLAIRARSMTGRATWSTPILPMPCLPKMLINIEW